MNKQILKENDTIRKGFINSQEVRLINVSDIMLTEPIHINAKVNLEKRIQRLKDKGVTQFNNPIIIKQEDGNKYSLVTGYGGYMIANALDQDQIQCIVVNESRSELINRLGFKNPNLPDDANAFMKIVQILIPKEFKEKKVGRQKVNKCIEFYNKNGYFDKPVIIQGQRLCIDGYSRLVAAKILKLDKVPVKFA